MPLGIQELQTYLLCVSSYGVFGEHLYFITVSLRRQTVAFVTVLCIFLQFHPHVVKHAALTPCCGATLHKACIQTVKEYMFSCPVCCTRLWQGVPDTWMESWATSVCRRLHRERNGIPSNIILPKL